MPTTFITAASGHIGQVLIPLLLEDPQNTVVLATSSAARLQTICSASERCIIAEGLIQDPQWVEKQLQRHSCDTVFLCLTGVDELVTTMNFFSAMKHSPSVKHLVYLPATVEFEKIDPEILRDWICGHGVVKVVVEQVLRAMNSFTYTIVGPSMFFVNDERSKDALLGPGIRPESLGEKGVSKIAVEDIAGAVVICIGDRGRKHHGQKISLGSKKTYTVSVEKRHVFEKD